MAGCRKDGSSIRRWWEMRAIPDTRRGIQQALRDLKESCTADQIKVIRTGDILRIGVSPQVIVNLENQENYIEINGRRMPYKKEIHFSDDLLDGKRKNVYRTAVRYYYRQACAVAEGMAAAVEYRKKANFTVRKINDTGDAGKKLYGK